MARRDALALERAEMISRGACAAMLLTIAWNADAGRPLTVEDAAVVEDQGCQVESWVDRADPATAFWVVPACNFFWNTELQAGFAWTHEVGTRFSDAYIQGKTLFRDSTPESPWSFATVVGALRRTANINYRGYDNPYVLAVLTVGLGDLPVLVHGNIGYSHDPETSIDATLWGVAAEAPVGHDVALLGEAFGDNGRRRYWRLGTRWTAIPNHLDLDLSYLARPGGGAAERVLSLGFTWQTGKLRP